MKKLLTFLAGAVFIALATEQVAQAAVLGTEDFTISGGVTMNPDKVDRPSSTQLMYATNK